MPQSVFHWGPLVALTIIVTVVTSVHQVLPALLPLYTPAGAFAFVSYYLLIAGILVSFFKAIYTGPGFVESAWRPEDEAMLEHLQFCQRCQGYKAPRSHHCSTCGRCSKKMDHHCPWINSCVGNDNHASFVAFVTLVPIAGIYSASVLGYYLFFYIKVLLAARARGLISPMHVLSVILGFSMATGVTIAVGMLAFIQWRGILRNMTDIEAWILEKAELRPREKPFTFPYNLGWRHNVREVFVHSFRRDGIKWRVRQGCHELDLTREQLAQKAIKRAKTKRMQVVTKPRMLGMNFGVKVCLYAPCGSERIALEPGDIVHVWRRKKHWYYGEKVVFDSGEWRTALPRKRGWFPKASVQLHGNGDGPNGADSQDKKRQ